MEHGTKGRVAGSVVTVTGRYRSGITTDGHADNGHDFQFCRLFKFSYLRLAFCIRDNRIVDLAFVNCMRVEAFI